MKIRKLLHTFDDIAYKFYETLLHSWRRKIPGHLSPGLAALYHPSAFKTCLIGSKSRSWWPLYTLCCNFSRIFSTSSFIWSLVNIKYCVMTVALGTTWFIGISYAYFWVLIPPYRIICKSINPPMVILAIVFNVGTRCNFECSFQSVSENIRSNLHNTVYLRIFHSAVRKNTLCSWIALSFC